MKRIWKSFWSWMLCICLLLQPLPSLAMDGEAKTEQKITVSLTDGGSVKVTDPKGTESEIRKADTGEPVTFTGTKDLYAGTKRALQRKSLMLYYSRYEKPVFGERITPTAA